MTHPRPAARRLRSRHDTLLDVEDLLGMGVNPEQILTRLGMKAGAVERALYHQQRPDLARLFGRLDRLERRGHCADCGCPISRGSRRCHRHGVIARTRALGRQGAVA
ncbi:MAG: hypothetical protein IE926_16900 [Micrococcales bacterium]|nr:hypothetical protein [Micrococcales bacterium]